MIEAQLLDEENDEPVVETYTMVDEDGEYEVEVTYGTEPWEKVFSKILRHHYIDKK